MTGRRCVEMVQQDFRMSQILTREAFENAIFINAAIGGSTNAVIHLLAIAGRIGVKLELDDWDKLGSRLPCLVNLMPSGKYFMEDFYLRRRAACRSPRIGRSGNSTSRRHHCERTPDLGECLRGSLLEPRCDPYFLSNLSSPTPESRSCAEILRPMAPLSNRRRQVPHLLKHRGRAVVFESISDFHARINDRVARYRRELRDGPKELRTEGISRDGRGG